MNSMNPSPSKKTNKRRAVSIGKRVMTFHGILSYAFLYAPILILVIFSFNASKFVTATWSGFTLDWYKELFSDAALGMALRNSLYIAVVGTLVSTVFGTMVALAMERYKFRGKLAFDALLYLPIIIPDIAMAVMLLLFFVMTKIPLGKTTVILVSEAFPISLQSASMPSGSECKRYPATCFWKMRALDSRSLDAWLR